MMFSSVNLERTQQEAFWEEMVEGHLKFWELLQWERTEFPKQPSGPEAEAPKVEEKFDGEQERTELFKNLRNG